MRECCRSLKVMAQLQQRSEQAVTLLCGALSSACTCVSARHMALEYMLPASVRYVVQQRIVITVLMTFHWPSVLVGGNRQLGPVRDSRRLVPNLLGAATWAWTRQPASTCVG